MHEVKGWYMRLEVKMQLKVTHAPELHEVKGWDMRLEVKMQLKVTHAPELTYDLMHTHCDLTAWRHTLKLISSCLIFIDLSQLHFCLANKNSQRVVIDCHRQDVNLSN